MDELAWLDQPSPGAWQQAVKLLIQLQAIEPLSHGLALTSQGQQLIKTGLEPRLGQLLVTGAKFGFVNLTCQLISILEHPTQTTRNDLSLAINQDRTKPQKQLAKQLQAVAMGLTEVNSLAATQISQPLAYIMATAWPDRIAQKQQQQTNSVNYKLANGRGVQLSWPSQQPAPDYLVVSNTQAHHDHNRDLVVSYIAITQADITLALGHLLEQRAICHWHTKSDRLELNQVVSLGNLILEQQPHQSVSKDITVAAICDYLQTSNLAALNWSKEVLQWLSRIRLLYKSAPADNNPWPDLSQQWLVDQVNNWLGPYLLDINSGKDLKRLDLLSIMQNMLDYPLQQQMLNLAPSRLRVPSGNSYQIDYTSEPPVLAVKLQELFGLEEVPKVAHGVSVQIHLLSPAGRPLQITQDLAHFWRHSYKEVKKEMQGRYPKHPWPDDPLNAVATAKTKNRR